MDAKFEVIGVWSGTQVVSLIDLADKMERFYFDEMQTGDSIIIKRIS